jgi:2-oxoglutarate ferredoxin oxidoreductase subunit alpha
VVKQCEDELAVINYVVGAGNAGARSACATAGGGFCLMIEGLGLAAMAEVPVVAISVMRGGPSTGLPTKQEQADLNLAFASNGDFPKFVIAPKDPEDAFFQAARALNLAEKYQTPVIMFSDLFLSEHYATVAPYDFSKISIERGKLLTEWKGPEKYKRYAWSEDGISPRLLPGAPGQMYTVASDEHDEAGIVISDVLAGLPESLAIRNKIHARRMSKEITMIKEDSRLPELTGSAKAELTLVGYGSTCDAIADAVRLLKAEGIEANQMHFTDIYPLDNEKVREMFKACKRVVAIENNISNQFSTYLLSQTAFEIKESVQRYDGEPFTGEFIVEALKKVKTPAHA